MAGVTSMPHPYTIGGRDRQLRHGLSAIGAGSESWWRRLQDVSYEQKRL